MNTLLPKLLSGRFILTLIGGGVFAWVACREIMPPEATASIITSIFVSYFQRNDRAPHSNPTQPQA